MDLRLNLRQVIYVLSDTLDLVGVDDLNHGKRVAYIASRVADAAGLDEEQVDNILHAGLLHDCGVSSSREHQRIVGAFNFKNPEDHCFRGHDLLAGIGPLAHLAPVVRNHHYRWNALQRMDLPPEVAFHANCIYLADRTDVLRKESSGENILLARRKIRQAIEERRGGVFAPRLVDAFLDVSAAEAFWLDLDPEPLRVYLDSAMRRHRTEDLEFGELRQLVDLFARIIDAKSTFTAEHSQGVARVARLLAQKTGFSEERCDLIEIAGLLHDLGKLVIPDHILEKTGPLDREEWAIMMCHTFYTLQILSRIEGLEEIAEWGAFHHEALSGKGYPFRHDGARLSPEARIMAVADVLQALSQDRPYRPSMPAGKILSIVKKMVAANKLDGAVVAVAEENFTACMAAATGAAA